MRGKDLLDFGFDGRKIGFPGFNEQIDLLARQRFAFRANADAAVMRQLEHQGLSLQLCDFELLREGLVFSRQVGRFLRFTDDACRRFWHPPRQGFIGGKSGQFSA